MTFKAKVIRNFLSPEECNKIVNLISSIPEWERDAEVSFWDNRALADKNIYDNYSKEVGLLIYDIRNRIGDVIKALYGLPEIYPDHMSASRWWPGLHQEPHADDMTDVDEPDVEWFSHRHFGAVIYLNTDYLGGHTYYPNQGFEIVPEVGALAIHPGDPNHLHGVTKVDGSVRYTLSSFWTKDKEFFHNWTPSEYEL